MEAPLTVELPVCPVCNHIGKLPMTAVGQKFKSFCAGPRGDLHKRVKMEPRLFREVTPTTEFYRLPRLSGLGKQVVE